MKLSITTLLFLILSGSFVWAQDKSKPLVRNVKVERKLQYLTAANGGLIGYYSDGTTAACPRCDLIKENIQTMSKQKPIGKYTATKDYIISNGERLDFYIDGEIAQDWAMINYKWIRQPE